MSLRIPQNAYDVSDHNRKEAIAAQEKCRRLQREKDKALDALKIKHRQVLVRERSRHSERILKQKAELERMWQEVLHERENLSQLLDERKTQMAANKHLTKQAEASKVRALKLASQLKTQTALYNELQYKLRDEQIKVEELEEKVDEYEVVIDMIEQEYEERTSEFKNLIDYIDQYVEEVSPLCIQKHMVKNKAGRVLYPAEGTKYEP